MTTAQTEFEKRAAILIERGIPTIPVPPKEKGARLANWQELATTNLQVLLGLNHEADSNTAAVAKAVPGGFCFFEIDRPGYREVIQQEMGQKFPTTFCVASSGKGSGRGHLYFKHTAASIALAEHGKCFYSAKDEQGELWSFRINNAYVVGPDSVHPKGPTYTITRDALIPDVPDWIVDYAKTHDSSTSVPKASIPKSDEVHEGERNNRLTSLLGRLRQVEQLEFDELFERGLDFNSTFHPPLAESEVRTIAKSVSGYPIKTAEEIRDEANATACTALDEWLDGKKELQDVEVVEFCAQLTNTKYENRRIKIAKKLGWRKDVLDSERKIQKPKKVDDDAGDTVLIPELEPWNEPVPSLAAVLDEAKSIFGTYIHFKRPQDVITSTLWTAQMHGADFQTKFPYLGLRSQTPECGKTTLLTLISGMVRRPFMASSLTAASIFRVMQFFKPTLLIDELDTWIDKDPELIGILNSGHSKEAGKVVRVIGDDLELKVFVTYGPKAYGMIGTAPDAFASRSLPILLEPKLDSDGVQNYPEDDRELKAKLNVVARKLARWTQDNLEALRTCKPDTTGLISRNRDNWRPLLVYAQLAGGEWPKLAREAAGLEDPYIEESENKIFLRDVRNIFHTLKVNQLTPFELCSHLKLQAESGWADYGQREKGITPKHLSRFFGGFGVHSARNYRPGTLGSIRSYEVDQMKDAFNRFLINTATEIVPVQTALTVGNNTVYQASQGENTQTGDEDGEPDIPY